MKFVLRAYVLFLFLQFHDLLFKLTTLYDLLYCTNGCFLIVQQYNAFLQHVYCDWILPFIYNNYVFDVLQWAVNILLFRHYTYDVLSYVWIIECNHTGMTVFDVTRLIIYSPCIVIVKISSFQGRS